MPNFVDRLAHDDSRGPGYRLAAHTVSAILHFYAMGRVTRQQIVNGLGLDGNDTPQLDAILATIDAKTQTQKLAVHADYESAGILLQEGLINKAQYRQLVGIP